MTKPPARVKMVPSAKEGPSLMERTRAAVCYLNSRYSADPSVEAHAFMALFHPDKDPRPLAQALRKNR